MGVENPDVEIGFLKSTTPDTIRGDVEAGSCLGVGRGSCQYFIGHRLKFGLDAVALRQGSVAIALRKGVEHPYIHQKMRIADISPRNSQPLPK